MESHPISPFALAARKLTTPLTAQWQSLPHPSLSAMNWQAGLPSSVSTSHLTLAQAHAIMGNFKSFLANKISKRSGNQGAKHSSNNDPIIFQAWQRQVIHHGGLDRKHSPGRRTLEGHQWWAVSISLKRVHGLGGLRQQAWGRLGLWGGLPWRGGPGSVAPPPGVLFHPSSVDAPPRQVNLANVVVHCRVIQKIQDQQHQHEKAIDPHSQQGGVIAGGRERQTLRGKSTATSIDRVNPWGYFGVPERRGCNPPGGGRETRLPILTPTLYFLPSTCPIASS